MNAALSIDNVLDFISRLPAKDQRFVVTTLDKRLHGEPPKSNGKAIVKILERMVARNALSSIADPSAWQREIREDRPLPGRS